MIVLASLAVFVDYHWIAVIRDRSADIGGAGQRRGQHPTGEHTCKLFDRVLIIGGNRVTTPVQYPIPVLIQYKSPDGKQLEDLARIVFIGLGFYAVPADISICRSRGLATVVHHVEETTHGWVERHVVKQLTKVAKRLCVE